jgi:hypothetical protein
MIAAKVASTADVPVLAELMVEFYREASMYRRMGLRDSTHPQVKTELEAALHEAGGRGDEAADA